MDEKTPGFGLRVTRSGAKSFIFCASLYNKTMRITIGDVRIWSIEGARAEATILKVMIDRGIDPRLVKVQQKTAQTQERKDANRQSMTVGDAWQQYVREKKSYERGGWGSAQQELVMRLTEPGGNKKKRGKGMTIAGPLASLMPLKLTELTPSCITVWLKRESSKRATSARQSFKLLTAFYNWCESEDEYRDMIPADAFKSKKVAAHVPKAKSKKDCLQREHLPTWFEAARHLDSIVISAYLQILLLTGARRGELAALKWTDVNFNFGGSLTLRDKGTTSGIKIGTRTIPLTPYVATLMKRLPRRNDYVFSSMDSKAGYIVSPNRTHARMLKKAGLPHVSLHGLRRSFKTLAQWITLPVGITDQIMGHAPQSVGEKHYTVRPLDMLRQSHERIEVWFLREAERTGNKSCASN